jgi:DNA-binding NarL/FixJ family response regulator
MRVVLADDTMLLREGVALLLAEAGFDVVAQAENGEALVESVGEHLPEVAIVDLRMPPTHTDEGLQAALKIRARHPDVGVMVLSQHADIGLAMKLLDHGTEGVGYMLKDRVADLDDFADAIRRVANGGSALDPSIVSQLLSKRREAGPLDDITPREREVLEQMAEGRSNQGIAERLAISERGVQKHVTSIFDKLGIPAGTDDHRRVLAVLTFLRSG